CPESTHVVHSPHPSAHPAGQGDTSPRTRYRRAQPTSEGPPLLVGQDFTHHLLQVIAGQLQRLLDGLLSTRATALNGDLRAVVNGDTTTSLASQRCRANTACQIGHTACRCRRPIGR